MALKSRTAILNEAANTDGASNEAILMAALNESQRKYEALSGDILRRLEAVESSVRASNSQTAIDVSQSLKNASETVLGDLKGVVEIYKAEVEQATERLQTATKKKDDNEKKEIALFLIGVFVVVAAAFYVALLLYGYWYDIPEAVGKLDAINAINNGIYQLLNR